MNHPQKIDYNTLKEVENDGKMQSLSLDIQQGATLLVDENPENRTAVLDAIQFALGGSSTPFTGEYDQSQIRLTLGENTYEEEVAFDSSGKYEKEAGYLEGQCSSNKFAFLHNSSKIRKLATDSDTLQDIIVPASMACQSKNKSSGSQSNIRIINHQLSRTQTLKEELATRREQRRKLQDQIEEMESELLTRYSEIEWDEAVPAETIEPENCLESQFPGLRETVKSLVELRDTISSKEDRLAELRQELSCLRKKLSEIPTDSSTELDSVADELIEARNEKQQLDREIQDIQNVIQFNKGILGGNEDGLFTDVGADNLMTESTDPAEDNQTVSCWVCNSEVPSTRIENGLESLQDILSQKLEKANQIENRIDKLQSEKKKAAAQREQRGKLQKRINAAEAEIQQLEEDLDDHINQNAKLLYELAQLDADLAEMSNEKLSNPVREIIQLILEIDRAKTKFEDAAQTIEELEEKLNNKEQFNGKHGLELQQNNASKLGIKEIESRLLPKLNTTMDVLLQKLDYSPLDRIWIDCRHSTEEDSKPPVFELKVERSASDSSGDEGTPVNSLCEADREAATFIFGLAGYLVHEVHHDFDFLLIDSIEFIDSQQIQELLNYLSDFVDYLVVGLPPEKAEDIRAETIHLPDSIEATS